MVSIGVEVAEGSLTSSSLKSLDEGEPSTLGRYELRYRIASGGMGAVYLGCVRGAAGFQKLVAVKVVHGHLAEERDFIEMFLDEAQIAAQLDHPNVASVFDFGQEGGRYYLAMEYLMGHTLIHVLRAAAAAEHAAERPELPFLAARIIADAAEGLHAAHELRHIDGSRLEVVHRDVSPQNLFVTYDGAVKVVDFGVARAAQQIHQTRAGTMKGKVAYAAPEQIKATDVDRRADIWALGVCLWEAVTLKRLFKREPEIATAMAVVGEPIPLPSTVRDWIPPDLDAIVMRALSRDVGERYATGREMSRDLRAFITRHTRTIGQAELSEWMERLLPEEKSQRLDALGHMDASSKVRTAPSALTSTGESASLAFSLPSGPPPPPGGVERTVMIDELQDIGPREVVADPVSAVMAEPEEEEEKRRWLLPILLVAGISLFLGALAGGAVWFLRSPPDIQATELAPLATATDLPDEEPVVEPEEPDPVEEQPVEEPELPVEEPEVEEPVEELATPTGHPTGRRRGHRRGSPASTSPQPVDPPSTEPERPRPRPRNTESNEGTLIVRTSGGWGNVVIDGRNQGRTPVQLQLTPGSHQLAFYPFGRSPPHTQSVNVREYRTSIIRLQVATEE